MKAGDDPIVVEASYAADIGAVWDAITRVDQMRQWYFPDIPSFVPELGFETRFTISNEGRNFTHLWTVTDVVPGSRLVYDWRYEEYPGDSFVVFELFDEGAMTRLRVTSVIRETFPQELPEFQRDSGVAGWKYLLDESLDAFLKG